MCAVKLQEKICKSISNAVLPAHTAASTNGQGPTGHLVAAQRLKGCGDELLGEVVAGPLVHPDREVDRDVAESGGRVQVPAGQVEHVPRSHDELLERLPLGRLLDGIPVLVPRLVAQRQWPDRLADPPALLPLDLDDEDVVHVVVVAEACALWRRDVGVDLARVAEVGGQTLREAQDRLVGSNI